jgi:hypothetical protein
MRTANGARKLKNVDWWDEPDTLPVVVDPRRGKLRRRLITIYLWVSALLFPFLIFAVIVLAVRIVAPPASSAGEGSDLSVTREAAQAQVAVERWLAGKPSPLPGGRVIAYTGSTSKPAQQQNNQQGADRRTLTTYSFVLADPTGNMYDTSIQMVLSDAGAVALADPALVPIPPSSPEAGGDRLVQGLHRRRPGGVEAGRGRPGGRPVLHAAGRSHLLRSQRRPGRCPLGR